MADGPVLNGPAVLGPVTSRLYGPGDQPVKSAATLRFENPYTYSSVPRPPTFLESLAPTPLPPDNTTTQATPLGAPDPVITGRTVTPVVPTPANSQHLAASINSIIPSAYLFTAIVLVNGANIGAPIRFEVSSNGFYQADRYYTELALAAMPKGYGVAFWSTGDQKHVEIRCGYANANKRSLIVGLIDDAEIDWRHNVVKLRGRDLTSLLIDNKTAERFANQTSSQVAELFATRRGLASSIRQTSTLVGTYYQREHVRLTSDVSEHDVLTFLAEQEGFNYYVEGNTLYFQPPLADNVKPFVVRYTAPTPKAIVGGTFIDLMTRRNETLAKDIKVKVVSWDGKHKRSIIATATRARAKSTSGVSKNTTGSAATSQTYVERVTGLSLAQAQALANQLALELGRHERVFRVDMPYDPALTTRSRVSLTGTMTEFDQSYYIDSIEYSGSYEQGSRMEITGRNTSPVSQVTLA